MVGRRGGAGGAGGGPGFPPAGAALQLADAALRVPRRLALSGSRRKGRMRLAMRAAALQALQVSDSRRVSETILLRPPRHTSVSETLRVSDTWRLGASWLEIGRASCRERVSLYVEIAVEPVSQKQKT